MLDHPLKTPIYLVFKTDLSPNLTTIKNLNLDSIFFNYFYRELYLNSGYRTKFVRHQHSRRFLISLVPTKYDLIDYKWNYRVYEMVRERCELDHALSWLSTLGGAFSALGDYFSDCAQTAGRISINQWKLALRLNDPMIEARCKLYLSLSLIQQRRYKLAQRIVRNEYKKAREAPVIDGRLIKMCLGIWSKLQYEHRLTTKKYFIIN